MSIAEGTSRSSPKSREIAKSRRSSRVHSHSGRRLLLGVLGFGSIVLVWYALWLWGRFSQSLFPRPDEVLVSAIQQLASGQLFGDIAVSVMRVLVGLFVGITIATPVGFLLAWYRPLREMFEPVVSFLRALPPIALIPLVIVYLGIGEPARISLLIWAAFFTGTIVIYEGVASIDETYIRAARVLGATDFEIFRRIVVPFSVPQIFVAIRVGLGVCWGTLVAAELIAARSGLGSVIQNAGNYFEIKTIYVGIVCIGILALIMDQIVKRVMSRMVNWQERGER